MVIIVPLAGRGGLPVPMQWWLQHPTAARCMPASFDVWKLNSSAVSGRGEAYVGLQVKCMAGKEDAAVYSDAGRETPGVSPRRGDASEQDQQCSPDRCLQSLAGAGDRLLYRDLSPALINF